VIPSDSKAKVTFEPLHGIAGPDSDLYAVRRGDGTATGIAVAIKDDTNTKIVPLTESKEYDLYSTQPTDLKFFASYESTEKVVGDGLAEAEVNFKVELP
jgi:major type 1 subunit fimbrin (pilin)